jgi:hypothetical protein
MQRAGAGLRNRFSRHALGAAIRGQGKCPGKMGPHNDHHGSSDAPRSAADGGELMVENGFSIGFPA